MEILHITGIHKQVGDPKKVGKKGSTFCPQKKVRSEGSPFFSIVENTGSYPNDRHLVQNIHTMFWRRNEKR